MESLGHPMVSQVSPASTNVDLGAPCRAKPFRVSLCLQVPSSCFMCVHALRRNFLRKSSPLWLPYRSMLPIRSNFGILAEKEWKQDDRALAQPVWLFCGGGGCWPPTSGGPGPKTGEFSRICGLWVTPSNKFELTACDPVANRTRGGRWDKLCFCTCTKLVGKPGASPAAAAAADSKQLGRQKAVLRTGWKARGTPW